MSNVTNRRYAKLPHAKDDPALMMLRLAFAAHAGGHYAEADRLMVAGLYRGNFGHLVGQGFLEDATAYLMTSDDRERILARALNG